VRSTAAGIVICVVVSGAARAAGPSAYERDILKWRADREARLKADDGWLTVTGLAWLKEGANRAGSNPDLEVPLPSSAPANAGVFTLSNKKVHFTPAPGVPLKEMDMRPDTDAKYDVLSLGRVKFHIIQREDRFAVRVKDNGSPARKNFTGLKWYPVDASWKIRAKWVKWDTPHTITFDTEAGVKERESSPGYAVFQREGKEYRLEPVLEDGTLFFVMRDATSGKTTYAASRFLYAGLPKDGYVELDFNKAENPPCVFTDYATCPLPPPQNRLTLAVTAGEMMYRH
jgi:uncharacterized protein (DUF1684 family)